MDSRQWTWTRTFAAVAPLAICLMMAGCNAGDASKTGASDGAAKEGGQAATSTTQDKSGITSPENIPELPPDPVKVTLSASGKDAESEAASGEVLLSRSR